MGVVTFGFTSQNIQSVLAMVMLKDVFLFLKKNSAGQCFPVRIATISMALKTMTALKIFKK